MNFYFDLFIISLLPLSALFTVLQTNPYSALVSRGILGVVAVLVYAVLGASDVALTEALVGSFITVILFAVTVRSTLVVRLGGLSGAAELPEDHPLRLLCLRYKLALKTRIYRTEQELAEALREGEVDAVCVFSDMEKIIKLADRPRADGVSYILLARHGRWHEKKLRAMFPEWSHLSRIQVGKKEAH